MENKILIYIENIVRNNPLLTATTITGMFIAAFNENIYLVVMNGFLLLFYTIWYFGVGKKSRLVIKKIKLKG